MIARRENGQATEVTLPAVASDAVQGIVNRVPEPSVFRPLGATPYTDENDPTDEEALPLSYDDRRDWYTRGQYSADCAPDVPVVTGQPDHGYFVDSELEPPRVGDPCVSCMGKPKVAGCMCVTDARTAYLALPQELVPQYPPLPTWKIQHALKKAFRGTSLLRTAAQGPASADDIVVCAWRECAREYRRGDGWGVFCSKRCGIKEMSA